MRFLDLLDKERFNIWRYAELYRKSIKSEFRLSLGEGWTEEEILSDFSEKFHFPLLFLKREDLNPLGSFKIRGAAYQISRAWQDGEKRFCISSTGNAALVASAFCEKADLKLFIFLHQRPKSKIERENILKKIKSFRPQEIFFREEPTLKCKEFSEKEKIYNLTPSLDKWSSEGFKSIGFEIFERILHSPLNDVKPEDFSIFSFSSSGASIIGIGESFKFLIEEGFLEKSPSLYPVKKGQIKRDEEVEKLIKASNGKVLDVSQKDINDAKDLLAGLKIRTSIESLSAFAGFLKTCRTKEIKKAIIILSGKKWGK